MKKSYRELKQELDEVIDQLSSPNIDIDEAIVLQKKGQKLIDQLEAYLKGLEKEEK